MTLALRTTGRGKPLDARKRLIAAVHAEAKRAGIDEDTYRALLTRVTGQNSAKNLTMGQLGAVLDDIKRGSPADAGQRMAPRRARAESAHASKMRALWLSLWQLGAVRDPSEAALASFARRQCHVDALQWVSAGDAFTVIEALKDWCRREGYDPKPYPHAPDRPAHGRFEPYLIEAQWARLAALSQLRSGPGLSEDGGGRLDSWIHQNFGAAHLYGLDARQLRHAVERLGQWIRRAGEPGAAEPDG